MLPLHQRLKMLKKGEKITAEEAKGEKGLPVEIIEQLAKSGVDVTGEILEMLLEARRLACTVQNAESEARQDAIRIHALSSCRLVAPTEIADAGERLSQGR